MKHKPTEIKLSDVLRRNRTRRQKLVEENEKLKASLAWAVGNLPFEHPYEWSDEDNHDAHVEALNLLGRGDKDVN